MQWSVPEPEGQMNANDRKQGKKVRNEERKECEHERKRIWETKSYSKKRERRKVGE